MQIIYLVIAGYVTHELMVPGCIVFYFSCLLLNCIYFLCGSRSLFPRDANGMPFGLAVSRWQDM